MEMSRITLRAIAVAGAIAISLAGADRANASGAGVCSPMWDHPTFGTWRLHPDSLDISGSIVVFDWHIEGGPIYEPGTSDASSDLEANVSVQVDAGPTSNGGDSKSRLDN